MAKRTTPKTDCAKSTQKDIVRSRIREAGQSSADAALSCFHCGSSGTKFDPAAIRLPQSERPFLEAFEDRILPSFALGAALNYSILYEGGNRATLNVSNSFTNTSGTGPGQGGGIGNIGVGGSGFVSVPGNSNVNGSVDLVSKDGADPSGAAAWNNTLWEGAGDDRLTTAVPALGEYYGQP